ncbi:MAG: UvrD-helicase domain-containing protein, partial [Planctomycetes bacterium]|nr:UvrD-helicase domain-containing protein [Planctomycetota bacterium]
MSELATIRQAAMVQGAGKKHWVDEEAYERFKDAAKTLREAVDGVLERMSFDAAAARPAAEAALQAIGLAADVAEQYERRKRELAVLDFNDLLIHARRLLVGPEQGGLRKRLASQIRLLLVDEFQDTDPLQVELVKALCDNEHLRGKLFLVGDYKQSIYRFRGADPRVFGRLREEFSAAGRLPLSLNFRSQPAVLDFVNALFAEELGPEYEPLRAARPQVGPAPAVEFLWACDAPTEDDSGNDSTSFLDDMGPRERLRRREAEWIARRIRAMLDSGEKIVWDEEAARAGTPVVRAVRPGDVALLFRAMTNAEYYEDALQRYGIDYYLVGGRAFYAQQEIYDLLNLLRTLDGRCDEVSLAGALRSPLFSLHDETLFWLARHREGLAAGLFEGELPAELDADQREQAEFAAATIRDLRALKDRLPVARLIQAVLDRTGYDAVLLAEFLGERKLANLHKLIEQARSFDHSGVFALSDFITQLAEFVARQPDEPLAATCPESTDVVKLMSIHQSKGLEFPVVIVPDVGRSRRIMGPPVAFTPQLGPMLKDPDATTGYDLFMAAENDEDAAEHSRLLYVAATRAADYLILSSGVERPGEAAGPWMELIARRFDLLTGQQRGRGDSEVRGQRSEVRGQRSEVNNTDTPNPESR